MDSLNRDEANIVEGDQPWLVRNIIPMVAIAVLIAAIIIGVLAWNLRQSAHEMDARLALMKATTPEKKLQVAQEYLGTKEAALALLEIGSAEYGNRNYDASIKAYADFLATYPQHALRSGAYLGMGFAQLAQDKVDPAIASLQDAANLDKESVYRPVAMLELSQLYGRQGQEEKQLEVLNSLSEEYATSLFGQQAIVKLAELNKQQKDGTELEEAAPAPDAEATEAATPTKDDSAKQETTQPAAE